MPNRIEQQTLDALRADAERTAGLGSWTWDVVTQTVTWSDNLYRVLGYDPGQIEPGVEAFLSLVHPGDMDKVRAKSAQIAATGDVSRMQYRIRRPDGEVRHVLACGTAIRDEAGTPIRIVGTIQDLTEQLTAHRDAQRSEARMAEAQAMAGVGSWEWHPATGYLYYSAEMKRILGIHPEESFDVDLFQSLVHPDDQAWVRELVESATADGSTRPVECRLLLRDGTIRHVSMRSQSTVGADGRPVLTGAVMDVTERVRLEGKLRHTQALEAVGQLASGIAHDFNNLLTVIMANASILDAKHPHAELKAIIRAGEAGADLTRRLLAVGRQASMRPGPVSIDIIVAQCFEMLNRTLTADVELRQELGARSPALADANQLHQILLNLVNNSRDAIEPGGSITIRTRMGTHDGAPAVVLEVSDDGSGMDSATMDRAFDPFFTTKPPGRGSGLGLSMVRGLVEQLGGGVTLDSAPGEGTTVSLWFRTAPAVEDRPGGPIEAAPMSSGRLLLVEDDATVRELVERVLRRGGFEVVSADGPIAARQALGSEPFVGVVSDIAMPDGGGRQVVADARARDPDIPIVLITGYDPGEDWIQDPVIRKPFRPEALVEQVRTVIARRSGATPGPQQ